MIAAAMYDYHADYGSFPPRYVPDEKGQPSHSWRVLLLPYIDDCDSTYSQYRFDEPWDGPHNRRLADQRPRIFRCPSDDGTRRIASKTNYFVVDGSDTAFPGSHAIRLSDISDRDNTILIVEAIGMDIDWLEPKDLMLEKLDFTHEGSGGCGISSHHTHGDNVALATGSPNMLTKSLSNADQHLLLTVCARAGDKQAAAKRQVSVVEQY